MAREAWGGGHDLAPTASPARCCPAPGCPALSQLLRSPSKPCPSHRPGPGAQPREGSQVWVPGVGRKAGTGGAGDPEERSGGVDISLHLPPNPERSCPHSYPLSFCPHQDLGMATGWEPSQVRLVGLGGASVGVVSRLPPGLAGAAGRAPRTPGSGWAPAPTSAHPSYPHGPSSSQRLQRRF